MRGDESDKDKRQKSQVQAKTPSQSPEHSEGEAWGTKVNMLKGVERVEDPPSLLLRRMKVEWVDSDEDKTPFNFLKKSYL